MILGLCTNSATWLYRFSIKNSVMDTWYLVSQVTHLNWPGLKSENFLASCGLQQFEVKSIMSTRELKVMTGHRRIPSKLRPRLFIPCFSRVKDRAKFVRWGGGKTLLFFSLYGLMTCYGAGISFSKTANFEVLTKKLFILTSWGTGKTQMLMEDCWSTFLTCYLTTYR